MKGQHGIWGPWNPVSGESRRLDLGPLTLWLERNGDEFYYASRSQAAMGDAPLVSGEKANGKPDDLEWNRWICGEGELNCTLQPGLPPRAVIVRPAMPVRVLPRATVEFFVSIPIWVTVTAVSSPPSTPITLLDVPSVNLSNSWFGLPVEGELCYALKTRARRRIEDLRPDAHFAVCPLRLKNKSSSALTFERLCLQVQHLSLYAGASHLWTNTGVLNYRGEDAMTGFVFEEGAPSRDQAGERLAAPREPLRRGAVLRALDTFKTIRMFAG